MSSTQTSMSVLKPRSSVDTWDATSTTKTAYTTTSIIPSVTVPSTSTASSKVRRAWIAIKQHAKEHHESVNAAYSLYYGQGPVQSPRRLEWTGYEGQTKRRTRDDCEESKAKKAWEKLKKHAKEHHDENNAAFQACYGAMRVPDARRNWKTRT